MVMQMVKLKYIFIITLMLFTFYLSDRVTNLAINKNPLMQEIKEKSSSLTVMGSNATIVDNTIIPGIKSKSVNEKESFFKMKEFGQFNETFLVYDYKDPEISLAKNKDKIIISGNKSLRQVSFIIEDNEFLKNYFASHGIKVSILSNTKTNFLEEEYLNSEQEAEEFKDLESLLKRNNLNTKICVLGYSNLKLCKEKEYYLVEPNIKLNNSLILTQKQELSNGSIILVNKSITEKNLNIILNQIKHLDLNIVYLSKLIKE